MQQTQLDRWLVKKIVHVNRIYFQTMPEGLPDDIDIEEAPAESGARFKYRATTRDEETAREACEAFSAQNITYTARVEERDTPLARFVGNPKRSVTILFMSLALAFLGLAFALSGIPQAFIGNMLSEKQVLDDAKRKK